MDEEGIQDYVRSTIQRAELSLLVGNIDGALAGIIAQLSTLEDTADHPLKTDIVKQKQAGNLETVEQVKTFLARYEQ